MAFRTSEFSKELHSFKETIEVIQKIDNKLGKSLAMDRATYKFQQIRAKILDSLDNITQRGPSKNTKTNPPPQHLHLPFEKSDYLNRYLNEEQKRDEKYQRFELAPTSKPPEFRKSKILKGKSKHLYTFYRSENQKEKHNRLPSSEIAEDDYKHGMYRLASNYRQDKINMGFIEEVLPKPTRNHIARRNLEEIFVLKAQQHIHIPFHETTDPVIDHSNIFLTSGSSASKLLLRYPTDFIDKDSREMGSSVQPDQVVESTSLQILNYKLVMNEAARLFKYQYIHIWSDLSYLLGEIEGLLKRYGASAGRVSTKELLKLQSLANKVPDKKLIKCLRNWEELQRVGKRSGVEGAKNKEASARFIQNFWRYHRHRGKF